MQSRVYNYHIKVCFCKTTICERLHENHTQTGHHPINNTKVGFNGRKNKRNRLRVWTKRCILTQRKPKPSPADDSDKYLKMTDTYNFSVTNMLNRKYIFQPRFEFFLHYIDQFSDIGGWFVTFRPAASVDPKGRRNALKRAKAHQKQAGGV